MDVSIGVMAHNEERNIGRLLERLLEQETRKAVIKDIIVVSSGSTDGTNNIVRDFCKRDKRVRLIEEPRRRGKAHAINLFLMECGCDFAVLVSGDVLPGRDSVERLCSALVGDTGVSVGRIVPNESGGLMGGVINLQWRIHHEISRRRPKLGEMIAFRKAFGRIEETAVDEEFIGMLMGRLDLGSVYVPDAIIRNSGPRTVKDFIRQRRRIYAGHLSLAARMGYQSPTLRHRDVLRAFLSVKERGFLSSVVGFLLENLSRVLGYYDLFFRKEEHKVWEMVRR
jgi:cellulose synthase/poly-beta-1,6-N-acetylglucosamine synthase-like glycosyltransferase